MLPIFGSTVIFSKTAQKSLSLDQILDNATANVDTTFGFDKAPDAHRRLTQRKNIGKVVLVASHATRGVSHSDSAVPLANERH